MAGHLKDKHEEFVISVELETQEFNTAEHCSPESSLEEDVSVHSFRPRINRKHAEVSDGTSSESDADLNPDFNPAKHIISSSETLSGEDDVNHSISLHTNRKDSKFTKIMSIDFD